MGERKIVARIIDFTIDLVLWASGILLIVFGSIALADPGSVANLIPGVSNVTGIITNIMPLFEGVAIFMIVLGCFLFLCGGAGCGIIFKPHKKSHSVYGATLLFAILTEIALIIYAAVFPGTMTGWVAQQMNATLTQFESVQIDNAGAITYSLNSTAMSWEYLQFESQCCGAYDKSDYVSLPQWNRIYNINNVYYNTTYPPSCCKMPYTSDNYPTSINQTINYDQCLRNTSSASISQESCSSVVMGMVWNFNYISIIISSCLIATELIGVILTARIVASK